MNTRKRKHEARFENEYSQENARDVVHRGILLREKNDIENKIQRLDLEILRTTQLVTRRVLRTNRTHELQDLNLIIPTIFCAGDLRERCRHCGALFFTREYKNRAGERLICCSRGTISFPNLRCPDSLRNLYESGTALSIEFGEHIRTANCLFAMASMKTMGNVPQPSVGLGRGHYCFAVRGELLHYTCGIPRTITEPIYNLYYMVPEEESITRRKEYKGTTLSAGLITALERIMRTENEFAICFGKIAEDTLTPEQKRHKTTKLLLDTLSQEAMTGAYRNNIELRNLSPLVDPLVYPLLFPCGEIGFELGLKQTNNKKLTMRLFYRYRIQVRDHFSTLHHAGRLFQQYLVDVWCRTENNELWYHRDNQSGQNRRSRPGSSKLFYMPADFPGNRKQKYADFLQSLATVMRFGKPHLFITFTCNPLWTEITQNLNARQNYSDRPDLVTRVFKIKLDEFIHDIVQEQIFGDITNYFYTIEFQKRGLPHAHFLVTLEDGLRQPSDVDNIIQARVPDRNAQPQLYDAVAQFQIHQCNKYCMETEASSCSKQYPRNYCERTTIDPNSLCVTYKRPRDGLEVERGANSFNNQSVVAYNPYTLLKYQTHVNFEVPESLGAVRYLYKYDSQQKRPFGTAVDEIKEYLNDRTVSAFEAVWRLLEYKIHGRSHCVEVLPVHDDTGTRTKLTAWFELNQADPSARLLYYYQIPEYYVWKSNKWLLRSHTIKIIGTIFYINPTPRTEKVELFYFRVLLINVAGAASFRELRRGPDGRPCATYQMACQNRGLLNDVTEFDRCLREYALRHEPKILLSVFANICCLLADLNKTGFIRLLWLTYCDHLMQYTSADSIPEARAAIRQQIIRNVRRVRPDINVDAWQVLLT